MKFSEIEQTEGHLVEAYGPGWVRISGRRYTQSLILTPKAITPWGPAVALDLTPEHLLTLAQGSPQVVLIGTGQRPVLLDPALYAPLLALGIGIEVMTTPAACRTYNLLMSEGRLVAAALILD